MKFPTRVVRMLPLHKLILLESAPDMSDNTKAVYDEMIRRRLNKQYRLIWITYEMATRKIGKHVYCVSAKNRLIIAYLRCTAIASICCNRWIGKVRDEQKAFYLMHGSPIKSVRSYYRIPNSIDYVLTASDLLNETVSYELGCPVEKCVAFGFPRNDVLVSRQIDLADHFGHHAKYVVWYPTVRQFKSGRETGSKHAIPLLHNEEIATRVNQYAMEHDILLILKPHFAQNITYIQKLGLSHIEIIDDQFFVNHNISSYEMIGAADALVSDYSSVILDYMLCDKPIGMILEDYEEYRQNPGLVADFDKYRSVCEQIRDEEDFRLFLMHVGMNKDIYSVQRNVICDEVNYARDGGATRRVVDFIMEKLVDTRSAMPK